MKKRYMVFGLVLTVLLTACGGSGSGSGGEEGASSSGGSQSSAAATAPKKAIAVAAMVLNSDFYTGMLDGLNGFATQTPQKAPGYTPSSTVPCEGGGSLSITQGGGDSMDITFDNCTQGDVTYDGDLLISGLAAYQTGQLTYTLKHFSVTGEENLVLNMTLVVKQDLATQSYDMRINGKMEETSGEQVRSVSYQDFHVVSKNGSTSLDGTISVSEDPDVCSVSGSYVFETIEPITYDRVGKSTGGVLKINSDIYTFNADGTISVNGQSYSYEDIRQQCTAESM